MNDTTARDALVRTIERLEGELRRHKAALKALDRATHNSYEERSSPSLRFREMRPLDAIRIVYREAGPKTQMEYTDILMAGGIAVGKIRKESNVRISFERNLENGNLRMDADGLIHPVDEKDEVS